MKTQYLSGLFLLVVACSGGQTTGGHGGESTLELKRYASQAHAKGEKQSVDVCAERGWYGDGECDMFCQDADTSDCVVPIHTEPVCAAFIEVGDGVCSRAVDDPCRQQDPDCMAPVPHPPVCPDYLILKAPDGVCTTDPNDPCVEAGDPDCHDPGPEPYPDPGPFCGPEQASDGVCVNDPYNRCSYFTDPDCHSIPVPPTPTCPPGLQAPDGVCKTDPNNICVQLNDPDCANIQPVPPPQPAATK